MQEHTNPAHSRRYVDPDHFCCPGCGEPVHLRLTGTTHPDRVPMAEWVHEDGSVLCRTRRGVVADPVEVER